MTARPRRLAGSPVTGGAEPEPSGPGGRGAPRKLAGTPDAGPKRLRRPGKGGKGPGRRPGRSKDSDRSSQHPRDGFLSRSTSTVVLTVVLVVLLVLAGAMSWYRWGQAPPEPSADRPVVISEVRRAGALAAAQQHTKTILDKSYQDYEQQTEAALGLIVDGSEFEDEYRQTAKDVKESFVEGKVELEYKVVGASVRRAGPEQVQALLFLNQFTTRKGEETTVTPYRALVTMVPSGTGWRVLSIETQ